MKLYKSVYQLALARVHQKISVKNYVVIFEQKVFISNVMGISNNLHLAAMVLVSCFLGIFIIALALCIYACLNFTFPNRRNIRKPVDSRMESAEKTLPEQENDYTSCPPYFYHGEPTSAAKDSNIIELKNKN